MHIDLDESKLQEYIGIYVFADASCTTSHSKKVVAIKKGVGFLHDGIQRDNAIYAKLEGEKKYRWFASFGGNYRPMTNAEIEDHL